MTVTTCAIAALAIVCVLVRPFRVGEAWWALGGAALLVACGAVAPRAALGALARGLDVYAFLIGMMVLAEIARTSGLFAWIAAHAVARAGTSRFTLLLLVYGAGIVTTTFLSNDATIVVLTPAVIAALRRIDARPDVFVIACALVANAASFTLPIANPANLLVYAGRMPSLGTWLATFALPSLAALGVTLLVLAGWYRRDLRGTSRDRDGSEPPPPRRVELLLLLGAAAAIVATSARAGPLGAATLGCATIAWIVVGIRHRHDAGAIVRGVHWPVVVLTAALFVIVGAVDAVGGLALTREALARAAALPAPWANVAVGGIVAAASNLVNNLPVGLNLGETLPAMHAPAPVAAATLVGVNLGPNATVNGSLATLLWLAILRRERIDLTPLSFAAVGCAATIPALAIALMLVP